jgi:hypothetical protein
MAMARRRRRKWWWWRRHVAFKVIVAGTAAAEAEIAVNDARWACRHAELSFVLVVCANKLMS